MPKKIDHEQRKVEIMSAALEVYAQEGKNANLSLIAAKCGLSRTTVYQYFKDESQLYQYASTPPIWPSPSTPPRNGLKSPTR